VWVLANRPGKLFHGNDFFNEIGDCFSSHVIPNPDLESEIKLLQSYAPNVDESLLRRISASFDELRMLFEQGDISYPYSTREAVAVAKHLEKFPADDVVVVLHNVLDLDSFDEHQYITLGDVFRTHGFFFQNYDAWKKTVSQSLGGGHLHIEYKTDRSNEGTSNPPSLSSPKVGMYCYCL
jgi:ribosomal protein L18E